ncbi:MAG: TIGR03905 family TSCPD domain-containing protein [Lachnospiraceae bacterium]|nr:TIGR03905 family TSCPD domain-containing protein [Lachnospiraceae bacterium]
MKFTTKGVCAQAIDVEVNDGIVTSVAFIGGCHGNTQGIAELVKGMAVEDVIAKLEGIDCRGRGTSCPDQLAKALRELS